MVFLTHILRKYRPHWLLPDPNAFTSDKRAFRRLKLFELTKKFRGRHRNVYRLAIRHWHKSLEISSRSRGKFGERKAFYKDLYSQRIWAGLQEHRFPYKYFLGVLPTVGIELDRKVCAHMAIWEPRTFAALVQICAARLHDKPQGENAPIEVSKPTGVITRDML